MNKEEALKYISSVNWKGSRLGLSRMDELLSILKHPESRLRFIHVAGTNGKGSFSKMMANVLSANGYKTGLYTSPHLSVYEERIVVDGAMISAKDFALCAQMVKEASEQMNDKPTEFEILTAMAFLYFEMQKCDVVVLEVGLGGRLDATNVVKNVLCSVIMNIGLEHTDVLGDTLEKIAYEKAGIIKMGVPVVVYPVLKEAAEVFKQVSSLCIAPLHMVDMKEYCELDSGFDGTCFNYKDYKNVQISLLGEHQSKNACVVLETIEVLKNSGFVFDIDKTLDALKNTYWPARLEILAHDPLFILDGAHNYQCAEALMKALEQLLPGQDIVFLIGVLADKNYQGITDLALKHSRQFVCVTPDSPRALSAKALRIHLEGKGAEAYEAKTIDDGISQALRLADGKAVVAFGSLYMAGAIKDRFHLVGKDLIRHQMVQRRMIYPLATLKSLLICERIKQLPAYQKARTVMIYKSMRGEVDLDRLLNDDKIFLYPSIAGEKMVARTVDKGFELSKLAVLQPTAENEAFSKEAIDLIICPVVAFDDNCTRLGLGKGYYDRYLSDYRGTKIGVAYIFQRVNDLPSDPWDVAMDMIIAE